jgi:hypothetical protein
MQGRTAGYPRSPISFPDAAAKREIADSLKLTGKEIDEKIALLVQQRQ